MSKFCCQIFSQMNAQWGSEIRPLNIQKCLQIGITDDQILNGLFFKQSSCSHGPHHLKTRQFCPNFQWFLTKWLPFVQISDPI